MTDDKLKPSDILARARRAWSPDEADAERVRRALKAALLGGPPPGAGAAQAGPRPLAPKPRSTWTSKLLVAGAIAAASGSAGYRAGRRAVLRETPPLRSAAALPPASLTSAKPTPTIAPPAGPGTPPIEMPSLVSPRHDAHGSRHEAESRTPSQSESLAIEVRALRNAERALRDGNPGLALAFLRELDRQVPNGQLSEERDAAATVARCAGGDQPFGVNLAEEFAARHPSSVYCARTEQACAPTDSPPTGDSTTRRSER